MSVGTTALIQDPRDIKAPRDKKGGPMTHEQKQLSNLSYEKKIKNSLELVITLKTTFRQEFIK